MLYRLIVHGLRQPLLHRLPDDFAASVAAKVARTPHALPDLGIEQRLVRVLVMLLALSAAVVCALCGDEWLQVILAALPRASKRAWR